MGESEQTWIARLTPAVRRRRPGPARPAPGLDVWERHPGFLVVAAPESRLAELERRRLARVDRLVTTERYEEEMTDRPTTGNTS